MQPLLEALQKFVAQLGAAWSGLSVRNRVVLVLSGLAALTVIGTFVWIMRQQAYRALYTELSEQEASAAVERLQEMQVPYRLAAGGATILVPEPQVAEVRLRLAGAGLPQHGRLGFELFDQTSFGATEFAEQVNFRRALEGELERSILSLSEVRRARVHVSLPKRSVFLDYAEDAKASVVLDMNPNRELSREQTDAIAYMLASAVEGLAASRVVIVDTGGRLLARPREQGEHYSEEQLEYRRQLEQATARKIVATLEPYVGFDAVRASVAAEVDWDSGEQTQELLDPDGVIVSTQRSEERSGGVAEAGPPGTDSNLPRRPATPELRGQAMTRTLETTNFQTGRTVTRTTLERGGIERLSVAVLVDYKKELDEEQRRVVRAPRDTGELETFRGLVMAAAGLSEQRGDTLTLEALPFTIFEPPLEPPPPPPDPADELFSLEWLRKYRNVWIAAAVAVFLLAAAVWLIKRQRRLAKVRAERQAALEADRERREIEEAEEAERRQLEAEEARMLKGMKLASLQTSRAQVLKKHLEESAKRDPSGFVQLIRSWIHEDQR